MNLFDFLSIEKLKLACENNRVQFISINDTKITFTFTYDVFQQKQINCAIAGKFDEKEQIFKVAIGINQKIGDNSLTEHNSLLEKIKTELTPYRVNIEEHVKVKIVEFLLSNPDFDEHCSFSIQGEILNLK